MSQRVCYVRVAEGSADTPTLSSRTYRARQIDADFAIHPAIWGDVRGRYRLTHMPTGRWVGNWPTKEAARAFVKYLRSRRKNWSLTNPQEAIPKKVRDQMKAALVKHGGRWA